MSDKRDNFMDGLFRDKLRDMEVEPAFHNWEMISDALPEEPSFYKRYAKELSIAAMMVLAIGTIFMWASSNLSPTNYAQGVAYVQTDQNMYLDPYMASIYGVQSDINSVSNDAEVTNNENAVLATLKPEPIIIVKNVPATLPAGSVLVTEEEYSSFKGLMASVAELQNFYNTYKDLISDPFKSGPTYPEMNSENIELVAQTTDSSKPSSVTVGSVPVNSEVSSIDNIASNSISIDKNGKSIRDAYKDGLDDISLGPIMPISAFSELDDRLAKITGGAANYDFTPQNHHSSKLKGLFVGLGAGIHNSWVLNKKAFNADEDIPEYVANYGTSYGVHIGYDFNSRFGIELDWILNSKQGQEFSSIMGQGQPSMMSSIQMDYMHLPFLLKYKWSKLSSLTQKPVVMSYGIGVQYSYLKSLNSTLTNEFITMSNVDRTHELGLALALDYDFYISDRSFITIGGRSSYGTEASEIRNALSNNSSKTNNLLLGVKAAYSRRLSR